MRTSPLIATLFLLGGCLATTPLTGSRAATTDAVSTTADRYQVGDGIRKDKLTIYPIIDKRVKPRPEGDFDLLGAAMASGTLTITEVDASGTVANLQVLNRGAKPVLLLAGDVITGGKQDRIVTEDLVLDHSQTPKTIAVNCVEAGRWNATSDHFVYGGKAEVDLKHTVEVRKDQSATWSKVAELNAKKANKIQGEAQALAPSTGTYRASLGNPKVIEARDAIVDSISPKLDAQHQVVGLVVAIGDDVIAGEIFAHPTLFEKGEDALLESFALEAVSSDDAGASPPTSEAAAFLSQVLSAKTTRTEALSNATRVHFEDLNVEGTLLRAGDDGVIHLNSYKKKE